MTKLIGPINSGEAVGADGAATANTTHTVVAGGKVLGVYVKYNDAPPAGTTDVTVATLGTSPRPPAATILALANGATDGWRYPRAVQHLNTDGTTLTTHCTIPVMDLIKVTIAQANAGDSVDVWLLLED